MTQGHRRVRRSTIVIFCGLTARGERPNAKPSAGDPPSDIHRPSESEMASHSSGAPVEAEPPSLGTAEHHGSISPALGAGVRALIV